MLNLGNLNVKDLFLGSTKVSSAWLGTQKVWPVGSAQPYDYRVEWIQTDGVASYIDTGIVPKYAADGTSKVSLTFNFPEIPSGNLGPAVCGARYGVIGAAVAFMITIQDNTSASRIITRNPALVADSPISPIDTYIHTIEMSIPDIFVDGINYTTTSSPTVANTGSFMLGCCGDPSLWELDKPSYHASKVRIYHCKIITDGVTVFDAFPVVKDGKAGLYDRVSGKVCFNANTTGTITAGPQVPFDYEVEWIQRDYLHQWFDNGSAVMGGFDISEYIPSGQTFVQGSPYYVEWSFGENGESGGSATIYIGVRYHQNIFLHLNAWSPAGQTYYQMTANKVGATNVNGNYEVFHTQTLQPMGNSEYKLYMDGVNYATYTGTATGNMLTLALLTTNGTAATSEHRRERVKRFRFGNTVDMIPVVKDDKMGFYNRVDGKVFLEKQPCLSAGPAIK